MYWYLVIVSVLVCVFLMWLGKEYIFSWVLKKRLQQQLSYTVKQKSQPVRFESNEEDVSKNDTDTDTSSDSESDGNGNSIAENNQDVNEEEDVPQNQDP